MQLSILSLNCENMADMAPKVPGAKVREQLRKRSELLAAMIEHINPDVIGMVEAATTVEQTQRWVDDYLGGAYEVHQGEKRGVLGLALALRRGLGIAAAVAPKEECNKLYKLGEFDADNDGIRELYSWANRVPHEVTLSGGGLAAPVTVIVIHAKSKGVFIPGDFHKYEQLARAARMKLRAQGATVRARLDKLVDDHGKGRAIVMGDMNDSSDLDVYAAPLGGAFLMPVIGNVFDPARIFTNAHYDAIPEKERWTIDYGDRIVNPITESRYGMPTSLQSWIDHILVSPELRESIVPGTAVINHEQPTPKGWAKPPGDARGTDHHPPSVSVEL